MKMVAVALASVVLVGCGSTAVPSSAPSAAQSSTRLPDAPSSVSGADTPTSSVTTASTTTVTSASGATTSMTPTTSSAPSRLVPLTWATSGTLQRAVGSFDVPYRLVETTTAGRIDIVGFRVDPGGSFPSLDHSTEVDVVGRQVQVGTYDEGRYVAARLTVSDGYFLTIEAHGRSVDDVLAVARTLRPMDEATWNAVPTGAEPLGDACFFLC